MACGCSTCPDTLALGWLANREREKRHGAAHLLQLQHPPRSDQRVRRELPVLLVRAPPSRRRRVLHDVARAGVGQAAPARRPAAHRSPRRQRPSPGSAVLVLHGHAAGLQADPSRNPSEVFHRGGDRVLRRYLRQDRRAGPARTAGSRARFACPAAAPRSSPIACARRSATTSAAPIAISRFTVWRTASACARTSRCSTGTSRRTRSGSITCCARGRCRTTPADSRRSSRSRSIPTTTRCASCRRRAPIETLRVHAVSRLMLDNIAAHQGVLDRDRRRDRAARAVVRCRRPRRHRPGRAHLPHGRLAHARGHDDEGDPPSHPHRGTRTLRARYSVQRDHRPGRGFAEATRASDATFIIL